MATQEQSKNQDKGDVIFESLRNELCQIFSCETKEKPKTVKNMLVKMMFSEKVDDSQPQWCLFSIQTKNNADKTNLKKLPVSRNQSLQMPAKRSEQSRAATLPSSGFKVKRTRSSSKRDTKKKGGHSWKMLKASLWQDRCVVKESGVLNKLTKEELLLQEVLHSQRKSLQKSNHKY